MLAQPTTSADKVVEPSVDGSSYHQNRLKRFINHAECNCATQDRPIRVLDLGGSKAYWPTTECVW